VCVLTSLSVCLALSHPYIHAHTCMYTDTRTHEQTDSVPWPVWGGRTRQLHRGRGNKKHVTRPPRLDSAHASNGQAMTSRPPCPPAAPAPAHTAYVCEREREREAHACLSPHTRALPLTHSHTHTHTGRQSTNIIQGHTRTHTHTYTNRLK
jgi:hypothetical protein